MREAKFARNEQQQREANKPEPPAKRAPAKSKAKKKIGK